MRILIALALATLPLLACAQMEAPVPTPWPIGAAAQPFAGPLGEYLQQAGMQTPGAQPGASLGAGVDPFAATQPATGYLGLSSGAADAVTGGWAAVSAWGVPSPLGAATNLGTGAGWGMGLSPSLGQPAWGGSSLQPSAAATGWSASSPWGASPGGGQLATSADPWSGLSPSGMQSAVQGGGMADLSAAASAGWTAAPGQAAGGWGDAGMNWTLAPTVPAAGVGAQGNWAPTAPGAFALGAGTLTLSPNPWLAVSPQGMAAGSLNSSAAGADLSPTPSPWLSASPGTSGLTPQPFSGAMSPAQPAATQGVTPGFGQPVSSNPFVAPQGTAATAGTPGLIWQAQPAATPNAWANGGAAVVTMDGRSWQVAAPNKLPDGSPATADSLLEQARQAGFELTPVQPQPGGGLEAPVMPGQ
jgi:hypothetical protein